MASVYDTSANHKHLGRMARGQVSDLAEGLAARARADLARHRSAGDARIEVETRATDTVISLVDEAALSIEFGRGEYVRKDGGRVGAAEGLHIIGKLL